MHPLFGLGVEGSHLLETGDLIGADDSAVRVRECRRGIGEVLVDDDARTGPALAVGTDDDYVFPMKSREERRQLFELREAARKETFRVRQELLAVRKIELKAKANSPIGQMNAAVKNAREWSAYAAQQKKLAAGKTIPEGKLLPTPKTIAQSTDIWGIGGF
ncbi:hypothetical protein [Frondihabitans sp. Leaf304]|uniref:hypothetical protein n=1 Tax=Frondihabitans sp. Leaf304 TaxID=1736329 RepID=UPI0006F9137C|nr:hypothetical protein [Frondihabitans sp. Leaf304]KQQ25584.1 hypothetical protein ASF54_14355 [Frondihabitans sp. Leaf304]